MVLSLSHLKSWFLPARLKTMPAIQIGKSELHLQQGALLRRALENGTFQPRKDVDPWSLQRPIDWSANPFEEANWQFQLHAWRMTDPLFTAYLDDPNPAVLEQAMSFVEDWYEFHVIQQKVANYSWYDMSVGIRALRIAFLINATRSGALAADGNRRELLDKLASLHVTHLKNWDNLNRGNHGLFQVAGLNLLCEVASHLTVSADGRKVAQAMFDHVMASQYTDQGVHTENSPSYHFFVTRVARKLDSLKRLGAEEWLTKVDEVSPWLTFPDGQIVPVGDSEGTGETMVAGPDQAHRLDGAPNFIAAKYNESGYGIVRSPPSSTTQASMLFVMGMAKRHTHKHADDLSFLLYEFDRLIFVEGGKYGYKGDHWRQYVLGAASHNSISLDQRAIGPTTIKPGKNHLGPTRAENGVFVIDGAYERNKLFSHSRTFRYAPGISLTIDDHIRNYTDKSIVSSLHLAPDLVPEMRADGFSVDLGERVMNVTFNGPGVLSAHRGEMEPVLGWYSASYLRMEPLTTIRATCAHDTTDIGWTVEFS